MNIYDSILISILPPSKYLRTYLAIIEKSRIRATSRNSAKKLFGYTERHHVLPKAFNLGGEKDRHNYVYLTAREHFICHKLLIFATNGTKYYYKALNTIQRFIQENSFQIRTLSSRDYEFIRKCTSIAMSGKNSPNFGKTFVMSEATKQKLSERNQGPKSAEHLKKIQNFHKMPEYRKLMSNVKKGIPLSEENYKNMVISHNSAAFKNKMSKIHRGKIVKRETRELQSRIRRERKIGVGIPLSKEHCQRIGDGNRGKIRQTYKCIHCAKIIGGLSNYNRWHNNNCSNIRLR